MMLGFFEAVTSAICKPKSHCLGIEPVEILKETAKRFDLVSWIPRIQQVAQRSREYADVVPIWFRAFARFGQLAPIWNNRLQVEF